MTKSTIKGAYSRGEQTKSLKPPFNPVIASLIRVLPFKQRDLLRKRVNSSNPFNLFTYPLEHPFIPTEPIQEKRKPTKEANKIQAPVSTPSYTNSRGEDLHLDTLQGHRKVTLQAPVSITPLTVEKVVCLVQMCPFSHKG